MLTISEEMENELKDLPDDAEHKNIANDYMRYLNRMDMRFDRVGSLCNFEATYLCIVLK